MRFPIERGNVLAFARSIGDPNPIYFDDKYATSTALSHLIAPPTYVQSSAHFDEDYPLRPKVGVAWFGVLARSDSASSTMIGQGLHAEQHFQYERAVRVGEELRVEVRDGALWERDGAGGADCISLKRSVSTSTTRESSW